MIDITSFLLKHLYELMADNYNATQRDNRIYNRILLAREQETNQRIVSFLINNKLPDLACETLIELIFICVFLAVSWIFVMILQLHCHQTAHLSAHPLFDTSSPSGALSSAPLSSSFSSSSSSPSSHSSPAALSPSYSCSIYWPNVLAQKIKLSDS
jgi:cytoskeletal protein RodZ